MSPTLLKFNVIVNYNISISQIYLEFISKSLIVLKQVFPSSFFITSISIFKSLQKKEKKKKE